MVRGVLEPESNAAQEFKWFVQAGWKDVPHLDGEEKRALLASTPLHQIHARTEGEPMLGSGAIYPIAQAEIVTPTYEILQTWRRVYALDVGWNRTAAIWGAEEPDPGIIHLYSEHYRARASRRATRKRYDRGATEFNRGID